jgi:hypothetical protein
MNIKILRTSPGDTPFFSSLIEACQEGPGKGLGNSCLRNVSHCQNVVPAGFTDNRDIMAAPEKLSLDTSSRRAILQFSIGPGFAIGVRQESAEGHSMDIVRGDQIEITAMLLQFCL